MGVKLWTAASHCPLTGIFIGFAIGCQRSALPAGCDVDILTPNTGAVSGLTDHNGIMYLKNEPTGLSTRFALKVSFQYLFSIPRMCSRKKLKITLSTSSPIPTSEESLLLLGKSNPPGSPVGVGLEASDLM